MKLKKLKKIRRRLRKLEEAFVAANPVTTYAYAYKRKKQS